MKKLTLGTIIFLSAVLTISAQERKSTMDLLEANVWRIESKDGYTYVKYENDSIQIVRFNNNQIQHQFILPFYFSDEIENVFNDSKFRQKRDGKYYIL
ncbi:MAG: hypothetical protein LIO79_09970 [Rikenellaceae bacterium]|nr:hypothetical protein [Rikenellaceae bacterium]